MSFPRGSILPMGAGMAVAAGLAGLGLGCGGERAVAREHQEPGVAQAYQCEGGTALTAAFYQGTTYPEAGPGKPPLPSGRLRLAFADGRTVTLERTMSADGLRYAGGAAGGTDSVVFWGKGNGALLQDRAGARGRKCVKVALDPGGLPRVFARPTDGLSLRYPAGFTVDTAYRYRALGPGREIPGVAFTVPASLTRGTNLSKDSHLSVETLSEGGECAGARFLGEVADDSLLADGATTYSYAHRTEAGAGNRYQEMVYAIPGTSPCRAVRYFLHWTVLENYPPGKVIAFDRASLLDQLNAMRRTLVIAR